MPDDLTPPPTDPTEIFRAQVRKNTGDIATNAGNIEDHHKRLVKHGQKLQELVGREGGHDGGGRMGRAESGLEIVQGDQRTTTNLLAQMEIRADKRDAADTITKFKLALLWGAAGTVAFVLGGLVLKYGFGGIAAP